MNNIHIFSVREMTVRDGWITEGNTLMPYYQEVKAPPSYKAKRTFVHTLKIMFDVLRGKYILVTFE